MKETVMTCATTAAGALFLALELGQDKWLLACATQAAEKPRYRGVPARDLSRLDTESAKAKPRFGLPADAPVRTWYEAGRDGFWLHRALTSRGIDHVVVDARAIEVNRRSKHAKTDAIDAGTLLNLLCRDHGGERKVWGVVHVPAVADEGRRQLPRGLKGLQRQRSACSTRIKGLLASVGLCSGWPGARILRARIPSRPVPSSCASTAPTTTPPRGMASTSGSCSVRPFNRCARRTAASSRFRNFMARLTSQRLARAPILLQSQGRCRANAE
jgi:hypothetical protein